MHKGLLLGYLEEGHQLDKLLIHGRIILKFILRKWDGRMWIGLNRTEITNKMPPCSRIYYSNVY